MDDRTAINLSVKTSLGGSIKRFDLPSSCTLQDVVCMAQKLYKEKIIGVKYKDEDGDLVTLSNEEEFTEALKSVPKTSEILRLYLNNTLESKTSTTVNEGATMENLNSTDTTTMDQVEKQTIQRQDSKSRKKQKMESTNPADPKKSIVPHKIESATKLSKDLKLVSSEVTGRIPVSSPASNCGLDTHFTSQKPGCRKIRHLSSTSSSNEKKTSSCAVEFRNKKRQTFPCTSSSDSSSCANSSSSSSESSSEDATEDSTKRPSSPTTTAVNKMLIKFEKNIHAKVAKNFSKQTEEIKKEIITAVTQSLMKQLDGAIIQSIRTNSVSVVEDPGAAVSTEIKSNSRRLRYHHHNVICDNCESEIFGPRFKCGNCSDYDLCERCEDIEGIHTPSHVFLKIHYPSVHAGRKSVGGKAKPLLNSNIYEEREKEREKEELLQRKFDSGSELCQNVPEIREKQKMRDAQFKREAREAGKEELRKLKKELRRNKREIVRKQKQQTTLQKIAGGEIQSLSLAPADFTGCDSFTNVCTRKTDSVTLQDENIMTALSGLKILETSQHDLNNDAEENSPPSTGVVLVGDVTLQSPNEHGEFESFCSVSEENDGEGSVEQVDQVVSLPEVQQANLGQFEDAQPKPDLVDFDKDAEVISDDITSQSEDFVVVSKVFDLSTPLNHMEIMQHLQCDDCEGQNCDLHNGECQPFSMAIRGEDECEDVRTSDQSNEHLAMFDLVASVPNEMRSQPDIASCINDSNPYTLGENLDDIPNETDTETYEHLTSNTVERDSAVIMEQPMSPPVLISFSQPPTPTVTPPASPVVLKQPGPITFDSIESDVVISTQPTIHEEIINLQRDIEIVCSANAASQQQNQQDKESSNQPKTLLEQATAAQDKIQPQEEVTKPPCPFIIEAQRRKEEFLNKQFEETKQHEVVQPRDMTIEVEQKDSSFGNAITDAMASVVDAAASAAAAVGETVINVVNQASGPEPTAEYHNGDVNVVLPGERKESECMDKLIDMGFCDRELNRKLLRRYNNDMTRCVSELVNTTDNQWHQTRH